MATKNTEVTKPEERALIANPDGLRDVMQMLAPGEQLDVFSFPTVKIPAGGGRAWDLPSGESSKELTGVIVVRTLVRSYWKASFDESGGGSPPDCVSLDNEHGIGDPGGECASCPLNQFGSGKDNAKACRQITRLFLLQPDNLLPIFLPLPPSSYKICQNYVVSLMGRGIPLWETVTTIGLEQDKSGTGIVYSVPVFRAVGERLSEADRASVKVYRAGLLPVVSAMPITEEV